MGTGLRECEGLQEIRRGDAGERKLSPVEIRPLMWMKRLEPDNHSTSQGAVNIQETPLKN